VINKMDQARPEDLKTVRDNLARVNPSAQVIEANSPLNVSDPEALRGRRALVIEDGPTVTHGGMGYGAGWLAARRFGAKIVDPRPYLEGELAQAFQRYSHLRDVLPALGYGGAQVAELESTVNRIDCDVVVIGTPIDLGRIIHIDRPHVRVTYELEEISQPDLAHILLERLGKTP
jgi:predicted GTPase